MDRILRTVYSRRLFYLITVSLLIGIALTRFLLVPRIAHQPVPSMSSVVSSVLDALFATGLSTATVGWLVFWLTPKVMHKSDLTVVEPHRISDLLEAARNTDEYWFSGGTGSYTRTVTLKELARKARADNITTRITILILDPTNTQVCEQYALYRKRVRTGTKKLWSAEHARNQLLATVVSAHVWKSAHPQLDITVGLKDHVSLFRIDFGTKLAVITKEDPKEPGLACESGTFFYRTYREELKLNLEQAHILPKLNIPLSFETLNTTNIRLLLERLMIWDNNLDESSLTEILTLARGEEHAYV